MLRRFLAAPRQAAALMRSSFQRPPPPSLVRREAESQEAKPVEAANPVEAAKPMKLADIKSEWDLLAPGAAPGTVPTDVEQATGLERLEIIGKMEGVDIFDMKPLDASRMGTLDNPITARSFGDEHYVGCTGFPADSHHTLWLSLSRDRPLGRCTECGNCIKMEYVGPAVPQDPNMNGRRNYDGPDWADYVRPEYHGYPEGFKDH